MREIEDVKVEVIITGLKTGDVYHETFHKVTDVEIDKQENHERIFRGSSPRIPPSEKITIFTIEGRALFSEKDNCISTIYHKEH